MTHARFGPLISAYMDGELTPDERAEVLAHARQCDACATLLGEYQRLRGIMREMETPAPPPSLAAGVRARTLDPASRTVTRKGLACAVPGVTAGLLIGLLLLIASHTVARRGRARGVPVPPGLPEWMR